MFSQPTVFVIGAGASVEFGMPSGFDLKQKIGRSLDYSQYSHGPIVGDERLFRMLSLKFTNSAQTTFDACWDLSRIIRDFNFDSIDEALHWNSDKPDIVSLGKFAIVWEILASESNSKTFRADDPTILHKIDHSTIWLPHLLTMAVSSHTKQEIGKAFSNVTIINFNYDRVIEHFLYFELQTKLQISAADAKSTVSGLKMIRPYGSIGPLPWVDKTSGVGFGAELTHYDELVELSKNVRTYTEQEVSETLRQDIQSAMTGARLIVFLGFGFHQQNMSILRTKDRVGAKHIIATVLGIHPDNYENMQKRLLDQLTCTSKPHLLPRTATQLMVDMKPTILNPYL